MGADQHGALNRRTPAVKLTEKVISSQVYGFPPSIVQPNGPTPLADSFKDHESLVDGGADRMEAAIYARGRQQRLRRERVDPGLVQNPDLANWGTYVSKVTP